MKFDGQVKWGKGKEELLSDRGLEPGGAVQKYIDNAVIEHCEPYTPFETGTLARSPIAASDIGSGAVEYPGPYAHYQYYGEVYGPNIPIFQDGEVVGFFSPPGKIKHPTGAKLEYNTEHNPLAGAFWFERAMADHKEEILKEAAQIAGCEYSK